MIELTQNRLDEEEITRAQQMAAEKKFVPNSFLDNWSRSQQFRPLTYLACPYTHPDPLIMLRRYEQATQAAAWLITHKGWNVFSPITHSHPLHVIGGVRSDWNFWKKIDYEFLRVSCCLAILAITGWRESIGVQSEWTFARNDRIKTVFVLPTDESFREFEITDLSPLPYEY